MSTNASVIKVMKYVQSLFAILAVTSCTWSSFGPVGVSSIRARSEDEVAMTNCERPETKAQVTREFIYEKLFFIQCGIRTSAMRSDSCEPKAAEIWLPRKSKIESLELEVEVELEAPSSSSHAHAQLRACSSQSRRGLKNRCIQQLQTPAVIACGHHP